MRTVLHYGDVIMGLIASQITSLTIVYSIVYSDADQRKHRSSASLAFVRGIHRGPVNSPHKWPVTRRMFPFDDVIMVLLYFVVAIWGFPQYSMGCNYLSLPKMSASATIDLVSAVPVDPHLSIFFKTAELAMMVMVIVCSRISSLSMN